MSDSPFRIVEDDFSIFVPTIIHGPYSQIATSYEEERLVYQVMNMDASSESADQLLYSGFPRRQRGFLTQCSWLMCPLFDDDYCYNREGTTISNVASIPSIVVTCPEGGCYFLEECAYDYDNVEFERIRSARDAKQIEMENKRLMWIQDERMVNETFSQYEVRQRAEQWWSELKTTTDCETLYTSGNVAKQIFEGSRESFKQFKNRQFEWHVATRHEYRVYVVPELDDIVEEEGEGSEETPESNVSWAIEKHRLERKKSLQQMKGTSDDSAYYSEEEISVDEEKEDSEDDDEDGFDWGAALENKHD